VSEAAFALMEQVPGVTKVTVVPETVHTPVVDEEKVTELVLVVVAAPERLSAPAEYARLLSAPKVML
jgi:hypothetical protein